MHQEDWAQFAILGQRKESLPSTHSEEQTKPASREALGHLEVGIDKMTAVCKAYCKYECYHY